MKKIKNILNRHLNLQVSKKHLFKPDFLRLYKDEDINRFQILLETPGIEICDNILGQLKEYIKITNASFKYSEEQLEEHAYEHISPLSIEEYGVWVYYPWSNRLVHLLDEQEFIEVRTSRNQYKITPDERAILSQKKIGVIGLSVGQSVSLTLAMERIGGELRLADFDTLELTNLNRIRTGVHNLGLPKVYAVAREIAEIDPFLKVTCFPDGLNDSNMDAFFTHEGKLDLLVEESDGFDIKILSRYKAKALQIPVIMEASDRCTVDVERFDLEPNRSILHGIVDHLDVSLLKTLKTTEDKIPYLLDMVGLETASDRLKASMLEIDQTINTWPQLASSVTMGGGITADVSRRLLLNYFTESGRYHVDIEELIGNTPPLPKPPEEKSLIDSQSNLSRIKKIAQQIPIELNHDFEILSDLQVEQLVTAGALAPSGGNNQPWLWLYKANTLLLFQAFDDQHSVLGYGNYPTYIALGAALENIALKSDEMGLKANLSLFPSSNIHELIASITFSKQIAISTQHNSIAKVINTRLTNRNISTRENISQAILDNITQCTQAVKGAKIHFITDESRLQNISNTLGEIEKIRLLEKLGHQNFVDEIRWSAQEALETKDGIDIRTIDLTETELAGFKVIKNPHVIDLIRKWDLGGVLKKLTKKSIDSASAIGVITMPSGEKKDTYLNGGRAMQRAWLCANAEGIAFQPVASSIFLYRRVIEGEGKLLSKTGIEKLNTLRPLFEKHLHLQGTETEIFIFRLTKSKDPKIKSLRKPLQEIYCNLNNDDSINI